MSNTVYGVTSKNISAFIDREKVKIGLATFVCMANDLTEPFFGFQNFHKASIAKNNRRIAAYERQKDKAPYFVNYVKFEDKTKTECLIGLKVYKVPEGFLGTFDEYQNDDYEQVGTLMKQGRHWIIETNLEKIEIIRRKDEVERMKQGTMWVGEYGNDYEAYIKHLEKQDEELGRMKTRGHGI